MTTTTKPKSEIAHFHATCRDCGYTVRKPTRASADTAMRTHLPEYAHNVTVDPCNTKGKCTN